jgi:hypothetical protein
MLHGLPSAARNHRLLVALNIDANPCPGSNQAIGLIDRIIGLEELALLPFFFYEVFTDGLISVSRKYEGLRTVVPTSSPKRGFCSPRSTERARPSLEGHLAHRRYVLSPPGDFGGQYFNEKLKCMEREY